jgi:hypothetical protein
MSLNLCNLCGHAHRGALLCNVCGCNLGVLTLTDEVKNFVKEDNMAKKIIKWVWNIICWPFKKVKDWLWSR